MINGCDIMSITNDRRRSMIWNNLYSFYSRSKDRGHEYDYFVVSFPRGASHHYRALRRAVMRWQGHAYSR